MTNPWVYWIFYLVLIVVGAYRGTRFRQGTRRVTLRYYRNEFLPPIVRNGALFMGPAFILLAPLLVISLPFLLQGGIDPSLPHNLRLALLMGPAGYFFLVGAGLFILAFLVPERLVPAWIREDDRRVGWVRRRFDWASVMLLVVGGLVSLVLGLVFVTGAIVLLVAPGIFGW